MNTNRLRIAFYLFLFGIVSLLVTSSGAAQAQSANNTWYSKIRAYLAGNQEVRPESTARYSIKGGTDLKALQTKDGPIYNKIGTAQPIFNPSWSLALKRKKTERKFNQTATSTSSSQSSFRTTSFYLTDHQRATTSNSVNARHRTTRSRCRLR